MSQPRRKMSRNSANNPNRFNHFSTNGRIVKSAKREPEVCLKAMERRQKAMDARREEDGDILYL